MKDSKKQLDEMWQQIENAKKEYSKIIIAGLPEKDSKEVSIDSRLRTITF